MSLQCTTGSMEGMLRKVAAVAVSFAPALWKVGGGVEDDGDTLGKRELRLSTAFKAGASS